MTDHHGDPYRMCQHGVAHRRDFAGLLVYDDIYWDSINP